MVDTVHPSTSKNSKLSGQEGIKNQAVSCKIYEKENYVPGNNSDYLKLQGPDQMEN